MMESRAAEPARIATGAVPAGPRDQTREAARSQTAPMGAWGRRVRRPPAAQPVHWPAGSRAESASLLRSAALASRSVRRLMQRNGRQAGSGFQCRASSVPAEKSTAEENNDSRLPSAGSGCEGEAKRERCGARLKTRKSPLPVGSGDFRIVFPKLWEAGRRSSRYADVRPPIGRPM